MEIKTQAVYLKLASREYNYTYQQYSSKHWLGERTRDKLALTKEIKDIFPASHIHSLISQIGTEGYL